MLGLKSNHVSKGGLLELIANAWRVFTTDVTPRWHCHDMETLSALLLALSAVSGPWQWRHNERDGVWNHWRLGCLLNRCSGRDQRKHQSSTSLAFVRGIHRSAENSPHKGPVTRKMLPFNTLRPRPNDRHFADDIFKRIFLNENYEFRLRFHWYSFLGLKLTIFQHWFR